MDKELKIEVYEKCVDFNGDFILDKETGEFTYELVAKFNSLYVAETFCENFYGDDEMYEIVQ